MSSYLPPPKPGLRRRVSRQVRSNHPKWSGQRTRARVNERVENRRARVKPKTQPAAPAKPPGTSIPTPQPGQPGYVPPGVMQSGGATPPPAGPKPPAPGAPAQPAAPPPPPWATDPILAQATAAYQQAMSSSEAQAAARRQQLLTQYGDPELARAILGQETPYAQAAEQNPFSAVATLRHGYQQGQTALNENLNKANLFYSSTRGRELDEQARGYQGQLAGAAQEAQGGLASIAENLLADRTSAEEMRRQAEEDAYERWLARALTGGGLPRR